VKAIPHEITESGKIDGAGDMKIFVSLILPMLKPALATIGLFLALGYWNEWYQSSLFLSSKVDVKPLQYTLYEVVNKMDQLKNSIAGQYISLADIWQDQGNKDLHIPGAVDLAGLCNLMRDRLHKVFHHD